MGWKGGVKKECDENKMDTIGKKAWYKVEICAFTLISVNKNFLISPAHHLA